LSTPVAHPSRPCLSAPRLLRARWSFTQQPSLPSSQNSSRYLGTAAFLSSIFIGMSRSRRREEVIGERRLGGTRDTSTPGNYKGLEVVGDLEKWMSLRSMHTLGALIGDSKRAIILVFFLLFLSFSRLLACFLLAFLELACSYDVIYSQYYCCCLCTSLYSVCKYADRLYYALLPHVY